MPHSEPSSQSSGDRADVPERAWHIYGHDETGEGWYADHWTDEEAAARIARNAGHSVVEYVRADHQWGAVDHGDLLREARDWIDLSSWTLGTT
jgi:hypothetical protein